MKDKPVVHARRRLLTAVVACAGAAMASAAAQQKPGGMRIRTREEVGYRDEPYLGRTCSRCVLYQGDGKCVILSEPVSANGWCTQWVPNTMG
jgi:ABC-type sugar transport system substrate-binding protein